MCVNTYSFLFLSLSFTFFFVVICLALSSQPGSGPRISPQRHNYHTRLNVPPTSYSTYQRPSIHFPQLSFPLMLSIFLSIITVSPSHTVLACSSSNLLPLSWTHSLFFYHVLNGVRWKLLFLKMLWRQWNGCCSLSGKDHILWSWSDICPLGLTVFQYQRGYREKKKKCTKAVVSWQDRRSDRAADSQQWWSKQLGVCERCWFSCRKED